MESETLTCPLCGAPYRETIPPGIVQVQCKYCGGTILVPAYFGGAVQRCPNHPSVLAVGLCNDCGGSYCSNCLSLYNVEHGTLHLCPNCFEKREDEKTVGALIFGVLVFLGGFLFILAAPKPEGMLAGGFFIVLFALPFLAWGIYRTTNPPQGRTIKEINEDANKEVEFRKASGAQSLASSLYDRLLSDTLRNYNPKVAYDILERRINRYVLAGMTRKEAVRKLAEEEGYQL